MVRNGDVWNGKNGSKRIRGLGGAKGVDVKDDMVVVAGSMDNAVVVFTRHEAGAVSYLDTIFLGLRDVASFHDSFNPQPLASLSPSYKVSFTGIPSSNLEKSLHEQPQPARHPPGTAAQTTFSMPASDGPVQLQPRGGGQAAADARVLEMDGQQYLVLAEKGAASAGGEAAAAGGATVLALEKAGGHNRLLQVQRLPVPSGVERLSHVHVPLTPGTTSARNASDGTVTFLAAATAHNDPQHPPRVLVFKWTQQPARFEVFGTLEAAHGLYVSAMAHTVFQGEVLLAISCFTDGASYPHASATESYVYRYVGVSSAAERAPGRGTAPLQVMQSLRSYGATDVAFWEAPGGHLVLMLSNSLSEEGDLGGDVRVHVYDKASASFRLHQTIAAHAPHDLEIFHIKSAGSMLAIANRQVRRCPLATLPPCLTCTAAVAL